MDPAHIDDDREAALLFYKSHPLLFDGRRRTVSVAAWLYDMEPIFQICHILRLGFRFLWRADVCWAMPDYGG